MIFALERRVTKKGKNSVRTRQVPTIRYKTQNESETGIVCETCMQYTQRADGCIPSILMHGGKPHNRIKVGGDGDFNSGMGKNVRCTDCGAMMGHYHHEECDQERCPVCTGQLITCECDFQVVY